MSTSYGARLWLIGSAAVAVGACSSVANVPPFDGFIALGTWGGDSAGMIVGDTALHIHIGCTYGDVSGRVPVGADGLFGVSGSYMLHAYPVAYGPTMPARFSGRLDGATIVVTVTVNDTVQHVTVMRGPATVTYGQAPRVMPCPICRRPVISRLR
jgi:hypothetical protein